MDLKPPLKQKIGEIISREYAVSDIDFVVEYPQNDQFGDYATNVALVLSKVVHQPSMEIARHISYKLQDHILHLKDDYHMREIFASIETVSPGFINLKLSRNWLLKLLGGISDAKNNYGVGKTDDVKRVALEHSNVNPNKAAHIGHLRNACIGQFTERVYEMQGYDVEVQYYANNAGVQVATSLMGVEKLTHYSPTTYKKYDHYAWDVYAEMETKIASDEKLQAERMAILKQLENPLSPDAVRQRSIADRILVEQLKTFSHLDIDYDAIVYESDILAEKLWEKAFEVLKKNSIVYLATSGESKGCWLVKLSDKTSAIEQAGIETDKIIVRSNGVATYTGKDIAYHMWKFGLLDADFKYRIWKTGTQEKTLYATTSSASQENVKTENITFKGVDYVIDVIGVEQTYAIDVVKKALGFLGYDKSAANMKHINYGFVFLSRDTAQTLGIDVSDGKKFYAMSGRKGWGVKIDDLIDIVDSRLVKLYGQFEAVKTVRNAAIKFSMLKLNTFQDLIFDLEESLDVKGFSGPYLQYACVRANAVVKKAGVPVDNYPPLAEETTLQPKEIMLMRHLARFPGIVTKAADSYSPNLLCEYLYNVAKLFNTFYNDVPILTAPTDHEKKLRVWLCGAFSKIMTHGLWILGVDVPEKM